MEPKAFELFIKYISIQSLMSKSAATTCAYLELQGRIEELSTIPGTESPIPELEEIKMKFWIFSCEVAAGGY